MKKFKLKKCFIINLILIQLLFGSMLGTSNIFIEKGIKNDLKTTNNFNYVNNGNIPANDEESDGITDISIQSNIPLSKDKEYKNLYRELKEIEDADKDGMSDEIYQLLKDDTSKKVSKNQKNNELELVKIICTFEDEPSNNFYDLLEEKGIYPSKRWETVIIGFACEISISQLETLTELLSELGIQKSSYIEIDHQVEASMYVAAQQMNVRPYVWDTLGYKGDNGTSIAIIDTGIDDSHINHQGYVDQDFTEKIVGWYDATDLGSPTPIDDGSHGSHCAGIAAGDGFETVDGSNRLEHSNSCDFNFTGSSHDHGEIVMDNVAYFNVTTPGTIIIEADFQDFTKGTSHVFGGFAISNTSDYLDYYFNDTDLSWNNQQLSYVVDSANLGMYTISYIVNFTDEGGILCQDPDLSMTFSWWIPYSTPLDSYDYYTGIAPESRLVGVKVLSGEGPGLNSWIIDGIDWAVNNKDTYNITVLSLSLGGPQFILALHLAVERAVDNGLVVVVAAGNDGPDGNNLGQPGNADSIISVAAITYEDNITSYSSQGGGSYTGFTRKPDIAAPGGAVTSPIYSSDSNDQDGANFADQHANDATNMQGTSMATPQVAGAANLIIDALGGWRYWNYSREQALFVKNLLLMTASETGRLREDYDEEFSPTLERIGKDTHEGYGRINVEAAIEAITQKASLGMIYQDNLYSSTEDVYGKHVWARSIDLIKGMKYNFSLDVPSGADFDIILYHSTPNSYGEPVLVSYSCNSGESEESLTVAISETGTYFLVIKAVIGSGEFILDLGDHISPSLIDVVVTPSEGTQDIRTVSAMVLDQSSVSVWAAVEYYNGFYNGENSGDIVEKIQLFDDGLHSDGTTGDNIYANTLSTKNYRTWNYSIDIIIYDPGTGHNFTYYQTNGGFHRGIDLSSPDILIVSPYPESIYAGQDIDFRGYIHDYSGIQSASVEIYNAVDTLIDTVTLFNDGNHGDLFGGDTYFVGSWSSKGVPPGTYIYDVIATDNSAANNQVIKENFGEFIITEQQVNYLTNYDMIINDTYNWQSATTKLSSAFDDDQYHTVNLDQGWTFQLYEQEFSQVNISTNGFLSFQSISSSNNSNVKFPSKQKTSPETGYMITPLWTDLCVWDFGGIYYTLTSFYLLVEWRDIYYLIKSVGILHIGSFEVFLYSNGTIKYQYNNLNSNISLFIPTCGINRGGNYSLETSFYQIDQAVDHEMAVSFRLPPKDEGKPIYDLTFPRPNDKLYGNNFTITGILITEPIYFLYRIYSYDTSTYIVNWQGNIQFHNLEVGNYRLETYAMDLNNNENWLNRTFTMVGNLTTFLINLKNTTNTIQLTWQQALDANRYYIYRSDELITPDKLDSLTIFHTVLDGSTTTFEDTNPGRGPQYYAVIAVNDYGEGRLLNSPYIEFEILPTTPPTIPSGGGGGGGGGGNSNNEEVTIPFGHYYLLFALFGTISLIVVMKKKIILKSNRH